MINLALALTSKFLIFSNICPIYFMNVKISTCECILQPQPNRGRLPPHQRLGQAGAANRVQMPGPRGNMQGLSAPRGQQGRSAMNKRIFVNPLFQGDQVIHGHDLTLYISPKGLITFSLTFK